MSVWYCIPSALPPDKAMACLGKWVNRGYRVAVYRDLGAQPLSVDLCWMGEYHGYAASVNFLVREVLKDHPDTRWFVTAGDDVFPDPSKSPEEIAAELEEHFGGTLGVMQPTGDRYMVDASGRCAAERVCVSPWMGREWCLRGYEGKGPLWEGYKWEYVDEDLHEVASKLGLLWHRPDISQFHAWHGRIKQPQPEHMKGKQEWNREGERIFRERKAAGFPNSGLA